VNLGCATGHPTLRDVATLHQPDAGADRAVHQARRSTSDKVYALPKHLDEKVARAAPRQARREADRRSTDEQAAYIGVPEAGPFKPDHYRY